ncbi:MAG TPA: hypothetical protein VFX30_05295 [bacterium]|nr:hypothetical protein [bacterium]
MYTSGFLGQMNALTATAGNWIRAGAFALGLGMVGGCSNESYGPDDHIPPLGEPDPSDTTIPDTPLNNLRACLPPDAAGDGFSVMVEATGARFGSGAPVNGLFRMSFPSNDILPDTAASGGGTVTFRARGRWNNAPQEWLDADEGSAIGPLALTLPRLSGEPFTNSGMTKPGITGSYANAFSAAEGDVSKIGFHWFLEGILHYTNSAGTVTCDRVEVLSIRSDARTTSGFSSPSQDFMVLSPYAPRADGHTSMAEADWSNEYPVVLEGDLGVFSLLFSGDWAAACAAGACIDVNGISNPSGGVRMRLIRNTASSAHDAGTGGAGGDAGMDGDSGSGGSGG